MPLAWAHGEKAIETPGYGLVVLDEVAWAVHSGWLDKREVLDSLDQVLALETVDWWNRAR
ncbi:cob(I)yrinic acid a,c-diamide adenosyltransferase [Streptomyces sp. NPDC056835]|uniref:cob(I)yrinic acid a,c-diamide adenosyltransferase n=1 Tax=Streptomyces sp. NPDC056835 TaxID=3345956 RepID=UPI0036B7DB25